MRIMPAGAGVIGARALRHLSLMPVCLLAFGFTASCTVAEQPPLVAPADGSLIDEIAIGGSPVVQPAGLIVGEPADPVAPPYEGPFFPSQVDHEVITIAAVGDLLLHDRLQQEAGRHDDGFISLWAPVASWIEAADIAYGNLEGPMAEDIGRNGQRVSNAALSDTWVYGGYPMFNYPPQAGQAIAATGFDVLSTANNHSMDRFAIGVDETLAGLRRLGLRPFGTRGAGGTLLDWATVTEVRGSRIGWIACTQGTNGIPDRDGQVLLCHDPAALDLIESLIALGVDGVIVTPHWGEEFRLQPTAYQRSLARDFVEAGAIAVIGSHPHVLQRWERIDLDNGNSGLVVYSLGNFVANQHGLTRRSSVILFLGLAAGPNGDLAVRAVRFLPTHVDFTGADGSYAVVRAATPEGTSSRSSWCVSVKLFGHDWVQPWNEPVRLAYAGAAATAVPIDTVQESPVCR